MQSMKRPPFKIKPRKSLRRTAFKARKPWKRVKTQRKRVKRSGGLSRLTKQLDRVVSLVVRLRASDENGICACYTCGHRNHYKKMQNGHYLSRFYKAVRWDTRNLRVQCPMCNLWKRGDPIVFRENLIKELGESVVLELESARHKITKLEPQDLLEKIDLFTKELASLTHATIHK